MENECYSRLFEIANRNMQRSGKDLGSRKAAFFFFLNNDPYETDALALLETDCNNEDFPDIAYMAFLGRTADESAAVHYKSMLPLPERQFRLRVISELAHSDEARKAGKRIVNFPDIAENTERKSLRRKLMAVLLPVYRCLPKGLKNALKKIMGANAE